MNEAPVTTINAQSPARLTVAGKPAQRATIKKLKTPAQPDAETVDRLNSIGNEYPFCVNNKQKGNGIL